MISDEVDLISILVIAYISQSNLLICLLVNHSPPDCLRPRMCYCWVLISITIYCSLLEN